MTEQLPAWGKTDESGQPAHHLAHHCMDVAAVLEELVVHPIIAARLATAAGHALGERERTWLAVFAFLHDLGKLSPGFQEKGWAEDLRGFPRNHLSEGWSWIRLWARRAEEMGGNVRAVLTPLLGASPATQGQWLGALFAHHGRPTGPGPKARFDCLPHYDWRTEEQAMRSALDAWFDSPEVDPVLLERTPLVHLVAGLLALADWIGSDSRSFAFERELDIEGYGARAREHAAAAVRRIGLFDAPWPTEPPPFERLSGHPTPRGAQIEAAKLDVGTPLAILEAETGSGKTEAALWHFARARAAGVVDALYFAVPTRAAASQLHRRVHEAMVRIGGPEAILAVPGQLKAGEAEGVRLPGFEVRWDDGNVHWAAEHATRFLAAPVAVGTIDQVLMAGLTVKHAHLRGAALSRSMLVIDEVHASDAYMNRVARTLVRDHLGLGGKALLMSATLGSSERAAWLNIEPPELAEAKMAPYPIVWRSDAPTAPYVATEKMPVFSKDVFPEAVSTMAPGEAAARAMEAARRGARVLIVRNTVKAAVATWEELVARAPSVCLAVAGVPALHHARFAVEDRRLLDGAIETGFGKGKKATARGLVAVGTQTLEQSLDIDADLLITDLCPMDVLLQRIGRLHRHRRDRPGGFEKAAVHVLCPEDGLDPLVREMRFENGLGAWRSGGVLNGIYLDTRVVEATRRLVATGGCWSIPEDNRRLVEECTHADALDLIEREMGWGDYASQVLARTLADVQHGALLSLDRTAPFPETFPRADEAVQTRLGARGVVMELPDGTVGPFGGVITRIAPPAHWCRGLTGDEPVAVEPIDDVGLRIAMGDHRFVYGSSGLHLARVAEER